MWVECVLCDLPSVIGNPKRIVAEDLRRETGKG